MSALSAGLSRSEFWSTTMHGLFRCLVAAKERRQHEFERDTTQAYQTVRVWVMTKAKKRLPKFDEVLRGSSSRVDKNTTPAKAKALAQLFAARTGGKVRPAALTRTEGTPQAHG